jgi:aminomethyltransferase
MAPLKRTPFYHQHAALGASFVERFGFQAAISFAGTAIEHHATRTAVGLFEVYKQFALAVLGMDALSLLQRICVNSVSKVPDGGVLYTSLCNEHGMMIDDLTVFRFAPDRFWHCPTPSRVEAVEDWLNAHRQGMNVSIVNMGYRNSYLSVQGPKSRALLVP